MIEKYAGSAAVDTGTGSKTWANTSYATGNTSSYSQCTLGADTLTDDTGMFYVSVRTPSGNSTFRTQSTSSTDTTLTYGGETDLWSLTPSASDIENSAFGIYIIGQGMGGSVSSYYLSLYNYDFTSEMTGDEEVAGIRVDLRCGFVKGSAPFYPYYLRVYSAKITVYEGGKVDALFTFGGIL